MSSNPTMESYETSSVIESDGKTFTILASKCSVTQSNDAASSIIPSMNIVVESINPISTPLTSTNIAVESTSAPVTSTNMVLESTESTSAPVTVTNSVALPKGTAHLLPKSGTECDNTDIEENQFDFKTASGIKKYVDSNGKEVMTRTPYLSFICCICKKKYRLKLPCIRHLLVEHKIEVKEMKFSPPKPEVNQPQVRCPKCPKLFTKRNNLYRHIRSFHNGAGLDVIKEVAPEPIMPISCPVCGKGFATYGGVNRHVRRHHAYEFDPEFQSAADMIPCKLCQMKFPKQCTLSYHMRDFHHVSEVVTRLNMEGQKEEFFKCNLCSVQIKDPTELRDHLSNEHNKLHFPIEVISDNEDYEETNQVFNCDECKNFFKTEKEWRTHMRETHNAFPDSCCRRCGKRFKTFSDLKFHLKDVHFFTIPGKKLQMAPVHRVGADLGLSRSVWVAMEKIPKWLVKHAEGQLLLVVRKD